MKKNKLHMSTARIILLCLLIVLTGRQADAQRLEKNFQAFSSLLAPEKLYIQTDRDVYAAGDTIWFKGYLNNVSSVSEYAECNYIYVEFMSELLEMDYGKALMETINQVRYRAKIKRDSDNEFKGFLVIPEKVSTGIAFVRGYSYWMRNMESELLFVKNIEIVNSVKDDYVADMIKDKEIESYKYYDMGVENPFKKKKQAPSNIDIQFLPESGRYLYDTESVIGIRAVADDGHGIKVRGEIVADDKFLADYETNSEGLGKVSISVPVGTRKIYAIADNEIVKTRKYRFPLPSKSGISIRADVGVDSVVFNVNGSQHSVASKKAVIHSCNGIISSQIADTLTRLCVSCASLPEGINVFTIVDTLGTVYAQREFFVYPRDSFKADVLFDKDQYDTHEKSNGIFRLLRGGKSPAEANLSISVSDNVYVPYSDEGYTAVSYHYLGSEFTSHIDNPNRYFCDSIPLLQRLEGIDLVMLTYGWKYYDSEQVFTASIPKYKYGKEYTQSISGHVDKAFGFDGKKSMISFVAPRINFTEIIDLEPTGRFALNGLDFPDSVRFLVGTTNSKGKAARIPILNQDTFADNPHSYQKYMYRREYDEDFKKAAFPEFYGEYGGLAYTIKPSFVSDYGKRYYEGLSPIPQWAFKPNQLKVLAELQPYNAYDLFSFVREVFHVPDFNGALVSRVARVGSRFGISSGYKPIIVYIDQMMSSQGALRQLMVEDVESVAYLDRFDAAPFQDPFDMSLIPVGVLFVKTKWPERVPGNVAGHNPIGWQLPKKKYQPAYTPEEKDVKDERMRATIYWNPSFNVTGGKSIPFSFFTSSHKAPYTVTVEGFTEDGKPVFYRQTFDAFK